MVRYIVLIILFFALQPLQAQNSVAREWNEALLEAIRDDFARPTVHARNLFHTSIVMYDAWAAYDDLATTVLLGQQFGDFTCEFSAVTAPGSKEVAREAAISHAAYRLLKWRFRVSPGADETQARLDALFASLGYDASFTSTNYSTGSPAALGNYIAQCMIDFGLQDGSQEQFNYTNVYYFSVNAPLEPVLPGNPNIQFRNRWQPMALERFIDQSGNPIPNAIQFLSPEWGNVVPFAMDAGDLTVYQRGGVDFNNYLVYHDPGPPPYTQADGGGATADYQWGFALVSKWSAHLDPADNVMWDISPGAIGNIQTYPTDLAGQRTFYNELEGGDPSQGHALNPVTGLPYETQMVPRGDYARVLAEFWADGPDSETPPGHWFTILNYVNDHPLSEKKFKGEGPELSPLEWDVKSYLALGGAMHDAAISAWGIKGWYDYLRPVSAIRAMCDLGQSTDPNLPNYSVEGIPLEPGYIELVMSGDPLAGVGNENVGKLKVYSWKGPDFINNPETDIAGVGWILAENWWPYQRPTFVTPPFAGYISGHSTFSRAAADVLTMLTGDPFFPGGIGEFVAKKNEFLVFEEGPSVDVTLQWATYKDASDQTSLSRIWGGIHPPADDIPGRLIGEKIAAAAFERAEKHFRGDLITGLDPDNINSLIQVYPNPVDRGQLLNIRFESTSDPVSLYLFDATGRIVSKPVLGNSNSLQIMIPKDLASGIYLLKLSSPQKQAQRKIFVK